MTPLTWTRVLLCQSQIAVHVLVDHDGARWLDVQELFKVTRVSWEYWRRNLHRRAKRYGIESGIDRHGRTCLLVRDRTAKTLLRAMSDALAPTTRRPLRALLDARLIAALDDAMGVPVVDEIHQAREEKSGRGRPPLITAAKVRQLHLLLQEVPWLSSEGAAEKLDLSERSVRRIRSGWPLPAEARSEWLRTFGAVLRASARADSTVPCPSGFLPPSQAILPAACQPSHLPGLSAALARVCSDRSEAGLAEA